MPVNADTLRTFSERYYNVYKETINLSGGLFTGVSTDIWGLGESGYRVLPSWIRARSVNPGRQRASTLDAIRPSGWDFNRDLKVVCDHIATIIGAGREVRPVLEAIARDMNRI